jgi:hypothetical protein
VNQKADADGPWGDEADAQAAADTQIITVVIWDTSNIQNEPEVYEPAGMEEEDMTDDLQVILVKHDQMFYRVVLANDDGTDDDDDGLDLRVRTNLDALLDENAPTTPSSRARDAINAVSAVVSGAVSSAYASFATSSTTANSNSREGEGIRTQIALQFQIMPTTVPPTTAPPLGVPKGRRVKISLIMSPTFRVRGFRQVCIISCANRLFLENLMETKHLSFSYDLISPASSMRY